LPDSDLKFSLILATVGRTEDVANFLAHLASQSYRCFELVVVDQNQDDRLTPVLASYSARFLIQHCRSALGLSLARNVGLKCANGNVIAFPDDDCWYPPDLLERVARIFVERPELDGATGRPIDSSFSRFHKISGPINKLNVFLRCSSFTIFLRRSVVDIVGEFDEGLGLGSRSGKIAAEESDYLIRALAMGSHLTLDADIRVFHREPAVLYDANFNRKARGYNFAFGFVLRKHQYPLWYVAKTWVRAFGGICLAAISLNWPKMRYHYSVTTGRVLGYLAQR
jgi:glycosyltransferase involved in cell wall biosynthesis